MLDCDWSSDVCSSDLAGKGMPGVMDKLTPADVEAIHQYVIKRAHDLKKELAAQAPAATTPG
jgi:quinohemoprotein ethanol dehydrogenase